MSNLSHYTKADTAIKILESKVFKFGHLQNTNDPFEKLENRINLLSIPDEDFINYWKSLCKFCNTEISIACFGGSDWHMPLEEKWTMWAHYAEKHQGVCFIFNKGKVINEIQKLTNDYIEKAISYNLKLLYLDYKSLILHTPFERVFHDFNNLLLFTKHKDWSCENEYRIVVFQNEFHIPIINCLEKVYYGPEIKESLMEVCDYHIKEHYPSVKCGKLLYAGSGYLKPLNFFPD